MPNQPLRRLLALALGVMCLVPIAALAGLSTSSQVTKKEVHSCDAGVDLIVAVQTHLRGSIGASMSRNRLAAISEITKLVFGETVQSKIDVQAEDEMETFRRNLSARTDAIVSGIVRRSYTLDDDELTVTYSLSSAGEMLACKEE